MAVTPAPTDPAAQLRWLVDRAEITDLIIEFARALDDRAWDGYAATYAPDGVLDIAPTVRHTGTDGLAVHPRPADHPLRLRRAHRPLSSVAEWSSKSALPRRCTSCYQRLRRRGGMDEATSDAWQHGAPYQRYVGRWSAAVAEQFVDRLGVPAQAAWLDVGCGTGALSRTVLARADPASVIGVDLSAGFVAHARAVTTDPRAEFGVGRAELLPLLAARVDAVVSGLVLNFVPDPIAAASEMVRVVRPGGTVAAYVWDYQGGIEMMAHFWAAAVALDPAAERVDESRRFAATGPDGLARLFGGADLIDVAADDIVVPTTFADFDDYWTPFLGGQGVAPSYAVSLPTDARARLRERLREALPTDADGSIPLRARAWTVIGRRAGGPTAH